MDDILRKQREKQNISITEQQVGDIIQKNCNHKFWTLIDSKLAHIVALCYRLMLLSKHSCEYFVVYTDFY